MSVIWEKDLKEMGSVQHKMRGGDDGGSRRNSVLATVFKA
jgi:hypothetical protein